MYLLYYIVNLANFLFFINLNLFNKFYLNFNKFNLIFKKSFDKITFFEKFLLVLFYKDNWFLKSILSFSNHSDSINNLRKKNHPLINFFYHYNLSDDYNFKNLFLLKKLYNFFNKNKFLNINFKNFYILQILFSKKYFSFLTNSFIDFNKNNFIKLFFLFLFFNKKSLKKKVYKYNLNYYNDWFNYNFNNLKYKFKKIFIDKKTINYLKKKKLNYIKNTINSYNKAYNLINFKNKKNFYKSFSYFIKNYFSKLNFTFFKKINFNKLFFKNSHIKTPIRFSDSSVNKYINFNNLTNYSFFYLRKNKIFNKGRYSRNRQLYRTGVYWCLWLNIIIVYGLYFFFYRFTFNFGYMWFGLFVIIFSTIFSRIVKYKFYNIFYLYNEFVKLFVWFNFILKNFILNFNNFLTYFKNKNKSSLLLFNNFNNFFFLLYKFQFNFLKFFNKKKDYGFVYVWKNYSSVDKSFLKYKSILNWFTQLYKVLVY